MSNDLNLFGKIINSKLEIINKESYKQWLSRCEEGSDIVIKIRNQKNFYSNRQLRLIYGEFRQISDFLGYSVEEVKTMLKMQMGYCYTHEIESQPITICKSISDFSKIELSDFIQKVDIWATKTLNLPLLTYDDIQFLKTTK